MQDVQAIKEAVGELDEDLVVEKLNAFIESKPSSEDTQAVVAACQQGMEIVGDKFSEGEYFVGDLIFAGELLATCIEMLSPLMGDGTSENKGTIVLGTVEGDIHDIGKNIFMSMSEAAGFKVVDLGIDQPPAAFVEAVKTHKPEIVGFSGVLTLSIDAMKRTVEALKAEGLREGIKIAIGGNAVNEDACKYIGADVWSKNAAEAVKLCGGWV
jgi:methanogenic corrinoid protein MtbC1